MKKKLHDKGKMVFLYMLGTKNETKINRRNGPNAKKY